jgi:hypothetical protein
MIREQVARSFLHTIVGEPKSQIDIGLCGRKKPVIWIKGN